MRKLLFIIFLAFSHFSWAQQVELTSSGFVDVGNNSNSYVVLDIPGVTKEQLYNKALKFVNSYYNNPKFVSSTIENDQIVIDGVNSQHAKVIYRMSGTNIWYYNYKIVLDFKDNRVRISPYFKSLSNEDDAEVISLIGRKILGSATGMFNDSGKILKEKGNTYVNESTNSIIQKLTETLKQNTTDEW